MVADKILSSTLVDIFRVNILFAKENKIIKRLNKFKVGGNRSPSMIIFAKIKRTIAVLMELNPFSQIVVREPFRMAHRRGRTRELMGRINKIDLLTSKSFP
jgi:hypothetical protein